MRYIVMNWWSNYQQQYIFAYDWSLQHIPPVRWLTSAIFIPGSPGYSTAQSLRDV